MENNAALDTLVSEILKLGAFKANIIDVDKIQFDVRFREMCASNVCGNYGGCWTCPPDCGDINEMIESLSVYKKALVYQTVGELEDSYDFETMMEVGKEHHSRVQNVRKLFAEKYNGKVLHLGAGGCSQCDICAKKTNEPCRHPDLALVSLEAYGINVSKLAETAGMKYINGQNTVTYFGAVFFGEESND